MLLLLPLMLATGVVIMQVVVAKSLEEQLGGLKTEMAAQFKTQEEELQEKIATLTAKLPK